MTIETTIQIDNFVNEQALRKIENLGEDDIFYDESPLHNQRLTSNQKWFKPSDDFYQTIQNKLNEQKYFSDNIIDGIQVLEAVSPYDVHSDYVLTRTIVKESGEKVKTWLSDPKIQMPTYTVIIPISEGYHTVVFDQGGKFNNFSDYKSKNKPAEQYCTDKDWQTYCSHCHEEDQQYLTINKVFKWKTGTLFAFNRELFHCSANFTKPKKAVVLWLSKLR
jgi:hypothetical protein